MTDFKVGDRVKRVSGHFAGMGIGDTATVTEVVASGVFLKEFPGYGHSPGMLEIVSSSIFTVGDKLTGGNYDKEVLHVLDDGIIITKDIDDGDLTAWEDDLGLTEGGYYIKETKDGLKEFTLQEIADKLDINVTDLRIRD